MMRDNDFGIVRLRAYGTYDFRIVDVKKFLKEVAGTDNHFRLDEFNDTMRSRLVSVFTDALATREDPGARRRVALRRAGRGAAAAHQSGDRREVRPRDDDVHRRERVGAARSRAGDRQALEHGGGRQPQRLRQVPDGAGHGSRAAAATGRRGRRDGDGHGDGAADDEPARRHHGAERRRASRRRRRTARRPSS